MNNKECPYYGGGNYCKKTNDSCDVTELMRCECGLNDNKQIK